MGKYIIEYKKEALKDLKKTQKVRQSSKYQENKQDFGGA